MPPLLATLFLIMAAVQIVIQMVIHLALWPEPMPRQMDRLSLLQMEASPTHQTLDMLAWIAFHIHCKMIAEVVM